ncbi:hypothetical protein LCGC14_0657750 [marine sediment metagenome]|uniref:Uncharacterized protein n=1 Tax=marine sediment metagenome TaxID=412755 RepID=A0A0F9TG69_9ZZZZ
MGSQTYVHGKITQVKAEVLEGGTMPFRIVAGEIEVVWFPKKADLPSLIDRLRHTIDQLAAIYYNRTTPVARGLAVPFDPPLPPTPDEEEESRCLAYPSHGASQYPDCPSPEDESDPDECGHKPGEDHITCVVCGLCRESLDATDTCPDCLVAR